MTRRKRIAAVTAVCLAAAGLLAAVSVWPAFGRLIGLPLCLLAGWLILFTWEKMREHHRDN